MLPDESVTGIAIMYDLKPEDIRQANGMSHDSDLIYYSHLKIPCRKGEQPTKGETLQHKEFMTAMVSNSTVGNLLSFVSFKT